MARDAVDGQTRAAQKEATLVMFDAAGAPAARYHLENAWPSKIEVSTLKTGASEVLMETMTFVGSAPGASTHSFTGDVIDEPSVGSHTPRSASTTDSAMAHSSPTRSRRRHDIVAIGVSQMRPARRSRRRGYRPSHVLAD